MGDRQRTVKALVCTKLGNPAKDRGIWAIKHLPPPHLPPHGVRIRVTAAALNFADALQVQGTYQERPRLPFTPGAECSGVVTEVGRDVRGLRPGDAVAAVTQGGAFAEEVVAPAASVVRLPASCDLEAAAGLPVAFGTAWMALKDRSDLRPGQTLVVLGAAGGVGLAAVQLGKAMGARVVGVARGAAKAAALREAGADAAIDLAATPLDELPAKIKAATPGGAGADVLFDPVGGAVADAAFRALAWGAQVLVVGFAAGLPKLPPNVCLVKNLTLHGIYWGAHAHRAPAAFRRSLEAVAGLYAGGDVAVWVSHRYGLEQAAEAFSVLMNRGVVGKLLLVPTPRSAL